MEEYRQILEVCNKFVQREVAPKASEADQNSDFAFPRRMLNKLSELELLGIITPEELGGTGLGALPAAFTLDALANGCASVAVALAYHFCAQTALLHKELNNEAGLGTQTSSGAALGTCVFPSRQPPSQNDEETLALELGGDGFVLHGTAGFVPAAGLASFLVVFAKPRHDLINGPLTCLIVSLDREGVAVGESENFGGLKAVPINPVMFDHVEIDFDDIIGEPDNAEGILSEAHHALHAFLAATAMGVGRSAYQKAFNYARERYQYGKIIAWHQPIQRMLGKMLISLHAGTATYIAALRGDFPSGLFGRPAGAYAKVFCTNASLEVVLDAVQIHGGYGYMQDYGVEKLMRDAKMLQLLDAQNPILEIEAAVEELKKFD